MRIAFRLGERVPLEDEVFRWMSENGCSRNCLGNVTVDDHHSPILIRSEVELSLGATEVESVKWTFRWFTVGHFSVLQLEISMDCT